MTNYRKTSCTGSQKLSFLILGAAFITGIFLASPPAIAQLHSSKQSDQDGRKLAKVFQPVGKDTIDPKQEGQKTKTSSDDMKIKLDLLKKASDKHSSPKNSIILKLINRNVQSEAEIYLEKEISNRIPKANPQPDFTVHPQTKGVPPLVLEIELFSADESQRPQPIIAQASLLKGRKLRKVFETSFQFHSP